ncbi:MAG TPA: FHA domain-containing protein, partial [Polyangiales bacterium]|nr:FHA domain-containing protein [Polyangiales bacterium]
MAELVLSLRDRELSRTPITHAKLSVGRDATCDLVIDNAGVSRTHAIVLYLNDEFRVRDMDSQNGITVNGKPVKDCVLKYGDVIGIGKFEMKLLETFEEITIESGAKEPRFVAPRNVMGTMQMSAVAVAGLRDQITAKQAGRKVEPSANGAVAKPKAAGAAANGQARDHKKTPAAKPRERIVDPDRAGQSERAAQPERAARPERAAQPERRAQAERAPARELQV